MPKIAMEKQISELPLMELRKEEIGINGNSRPRCKLPITTLEFTKAVTTGNVKSEIWDDVFEVSKKNRNSNKR